MHWNVFNIQCTIGSRYTVFEPLHPHPHHSYCYWLDSMNIEYLIVVRSKIEALSLNICGKYLRWDAAEWRCPGQRPSGGWRWVVTSVMDPGCPGLAPELLTGAQCLSSLARSHEKHSGEECQYVNILSQSWMGKNQNVKNIQWAINILLFTQIFAQFTLISCLFIYKTYQENKPYYIWAILSITESSDLWASMF